jgi:S1-C subfamily serine protease
MIPIAAKVQQTTVKPPLPLGPSKKPAKPPTPPGKIEGAVASKQVPALAPTDHEEGWHPALWGLIGGIGVAVAALIIGFVLPRGGKTSADLKQEQEPAQQVIGEEDSRPVMEQTPRAKTQLSAEELYAQASPGVVTILCHFREYGGGDSVIQGSGFFLKEELIHNPDDQMSREMVMTLSKEKGQSAHLSYLLTNHHVVKSAAAGEIKLSDGSKGRIESVVSQDEPADLALLSAVVFSSNSLTPLPLADTTPRVGATVYAIGSPKGYANSLSSGIVSGFREIKPGITWLQTTAPISPGSSGGPLLNLSGEVVGVTTIIRRDAQNLNFAVPVSEIRRFLSAPYRQRKFRQGGTPGEERNWTEEERENIARFVRALRREYDAWSGTHGQKPITPEEIVAVGRVMQEASDNADQVKLEILRRVHPDLPKLFRDTFQSWVDEAGASLRSGEMPDKELVELLSKWVEWWKFHRHELHVPNDTPLWDAENKDVIWRNGPNN